MRTKYKILFTIPYLIAYFMLFASAHNLSVQQSAIQLHALKRSDTVKVTYANATTEIVNKTDNKEARKSKTNFPNKSSFSIQKND